MPKSPSEGKGLMRIAQGNLVRQVKGPLALLVTNKGASALSPQTRGEVSALQKQGHDALASEMERLHSGAMAVEIASDFSASTSALNASLKALSKGLAGDMSAKLPLAKITFGIFGGEGLIETKGASSVLEKGHVSTGGWESSFASFAAKYAEKPDPNRRDLLISFHDARPESNHDLFGAIEKINATEGIVVIAYLPSGDSTEADRSVLRDLTNPALGGFKNGIFIDLSGVNYGDPAILQGLLDQLIAAVAESSKSTTSLTTGSSTILDLRSLADGIVQRARVLSSATGPKALLKG